MLLSGVLGADVNPLPSRIRAPFGLTRVGGATYFSQHDGVNGSELWKTDGTDAGTVMIKDIFPGLGSGSPSGYVATDDGTVFFVATDGTKGYELWKTDGTEAGTVLVKHLDGPGEFDSQQSDAGGEPGLLFRQRRGARQRVVGERWDGCRHLSG